MATKTKKKTVKKVQKKSSFEALTRVQQFFVDGHHGKQTAAWVAGELGISVGVVAGRYEELAQTNPLPSPLQKAGIGVTREAVVMTADASGKGDELKAKSPRPSARKAPGLHIIDPKRKGF
jgi:hypothetical protein